MNATDRRKYQQEYELVNRRFTKKYSPKVVKAVGELVSSLITDIQKEGVNAAKYNLFTTVSNNQLAKVVEDLYKEVGLYHAKLNYRRIKAEIGQKQLGRNEQWIQEILNYLRSHLIDKAVLESTRNAKSQLMKLLEQAVDTGMSEFEMVKYIRENAIRVIQPQRIVRTELNIASNTGVLVAAQSFEYDFNKEWIAHRDIRTRGIMPNDKHDHFHLDGKVVDLEEDFKDPISGENIAYPSAPGGSAGMVINCRCTYATVPKRDESGRLIKKPRKNITTGVPIG